MNKALFCTLIIAANAILFSRTGSANDHLTGRSLCTEGASFEKRRLAGDQVDDICQTHLGKVMLIVNTASQCGFTYQYEGLETLYERYRDQGLVVLGFPSNDFGGQEPGSEKQIQNFCVNTYAIKFPMYEKTRIKGSNKDPLYQALISASGSEPRWNFHKYLVDRNGVVVSSYSSSTKPLSRKLVDQIETLLSSADQSLSALTSSPKTVQL